MSFNSPYSSSGGSSEKPTPNMFPAPTSSPTDFNFTDVPNYGAVPEVQPTGKNSTLSIIGLILAILLPLFGLVFSIIAWKQAFETGDNRNLPKAGIIVSVVMLVLNLIATIVLFSLIASTTIHGTTVPAS